MTRLTSHELSGRSTTYNAADQPLRKRQINHWCYLPQVPGLSELLPRRAHENVRAALADTRVVVINGARQTGKSTLARLVADGLPGAELRYLNEAAVRSAAQADPAWFVRHDGLLVLDEVQRVPDLLLAIKYEVDLDPRPGRFLLTGSARLLAQERPADMRRLLNLVAASMATLAVPAAFANHLRLPASTVKRYLDLLELLYMVLYMVRRIPAWSTNLTTRVVATPKLMVVNSGLAGHLAGMTVKRAQHPTAPVGPIIENFVLGELTRQLSWVDEPVRLYHYRDRDGNEVDAILERASGEIVAVEVKAAETVRSEDFRGIQHLARRLGDQMLAGFVLYAGRQALPFGERFCALPISALWTTSLSSA